jgi:hypothetical protein
VYLGRRYCPTSAFIASNDPLTVKAGLSLRVDAAINESYIGIGTMWCDLSGNGNHMNWSASAAPLFTSFNGFGILRTSPITGKRNAIASVAYNNLRTGSAPYSVTVAFKPNSIASSKVLVSMGNPADTTVGDVITPISIGSAGKFAGGSYNCATSNTGCTWSSAVEVSPSTLQV